MRCEKCGAESPSGSQHCVHCGHESLGAEKKTQFGMPVFKPGDEAPATGDHLLAGLPPPPRSSAPSPLAPSTPTAPSQPSGTRMGMPRAPASEAADATQFGMPRIIPDATPPPSTEAAAPGKVDKTVFGMPRVSPQAASPDDAPFDPLAPTLAIDQGPLRALDEAEAAERARAGEAPTESPEAPPLEAPDLSEDGVDPLAPTASVNFSLEEEAELAAARAMARAARAAAKARKAGHPTQGPKAAEMQLITGEVLAEKTPLARPQSTAELALGLAPTAPGEDEAFKPQPRVKLSRPIIETRASRDDLSAQPTEPARPAARADSAIIDEDDFEDFHEAATNASLSRGFALLLGLGLLGLALYPLHHRWIWEALPRAQGHDLYALYALLGGGGLAALFGALPLPAGARFALSLITGGVGVAALAYLRFL